MATTLKAGEWPEQLETALFNAMMAHRPAGTEDPFFLLLANGPLFHSLAHTHTHTHTHSLSLSLSLSLCAPFFDIWDRCAQAHQHGNGVHAAVAPRASAHDKRHLEPPQDVV